MRMKSIRKNFYRGWVNRKKRATLKIILDYKNLNENEIERKI
jgi:hypothetical protein